MLVILLARGLTVRMAGRQLRRWVRTMKMLVMRWLKKIWTDILRIVNFLLGIES